MLVGCSLRTGVHAAKSLPGTLRWTGQAQGLSMRLYFGYLHVSIYEPDRSPISGTSACDMSPVTWCHSVPVAPVWDGELLSASEYALRKSKPCWNPAHTEQESEAHQQLSCVTPYTEHYHVPKIQILP